MNCTVRVRVRARVNKHEEVFVDENKNLNLENRTIRARVSKLDEIEGENYVTQRDVIRELSS